MQLIRPKHHMLLLFLSMVLINFVTRNVLYNNQIKEIYPINGDSISIPIYTTFIATLVIFFLSSVGLMLSSIKWVSWIGIAMTLTAVIFVLGSCFEWSSEHHWWIAISHSIAILICTNIFFVSIKLRSRK